MWVENHHLKGLLEEQIFRTFPIEILRNFTTPSMQKLPLSR